MLQRALMVLAALIPVLSAAQDDDYRVLSLMSQDENGLFVLTITATPEKVEAKVQPLGRPQSPDPKRATYPRELFDALWVEVDNGLLSRYVTDVTPGSRDDGGAARNFIVSTSNGVSGRHFMVPKCAASPAIVTFVRRLTNDLLPAGSPGMPRACKRANRDPTAAAPMADSRTILILAPQGVDPAKDTIGFNTLVKNLTQEFSATLSDELAGRGLGPVNVIDQRPDLDVGQKMALHAARNAATNLVILTVETESVGEDTQLQLRAQYVDGDLTTSGVAPVAFRTRTVTTKSYVLRSKSGDTTLTLVDLARDFVGFLESAGRLEK